MTSIGIISNTDCVGSSGDWFNAIYSGISMAQVWDRFYGGLATDGRRQREYIYGFANGAVILFTSISESWVISVGTWVVGDV